MLRIWKIVNDSSTFTAARTSQITTSCPYVRTSQYALLQGYVRVGHSSLYIYYELLVALYIMNSLVYW